MRSLFFGAGIVGVASAAACGQGSGTSSSASAVTTSASDWWASERTARDSAYTAYLTSHADTYADFANNAVSSSAAENIPFIIYRLFPEITTDASGQSYGLITGSNIGAGNLHAASAVTPLGFTRTDVSATTGVSYLGRTCGGCHSGRVDLGNGTTRILPGMPNTELRFSESLNGIYSSVVNLFGGDPAVAKQAVLARLATSSVTDIFGPGADQDVGNAEIAQFQQNLDSLLSTMVSVAKARLLTLSDYSGIAYGGSQSTASGKESAGIADPMPGFFDSEGVGASTSYGFAAYFATLKAGLPESVAEAALRTANAAVLTLAGSAIVDIPSTWLKGNESVYQWNGDTRGEFFRNAGAVLGGMTASAGDVLDARVDQISGFIDALPAPPYPFALEGTQDLWTRGQAVYNKNCAGCHQSDQHNLPASWADSSGDPLLWDVGTDVNRSEVASFLYRQGLLSSLDTVCGLPGAPDECQSLPRDQRLIARPKGQYVAMPLDGIWARAPYLHNGSVPTLRHLLVPSTRPASSSAG